MTNHTSNVVRILREICEEKQISLRSYADEWAWELEKDGVRNYIFGYQFGLNRAVTASICNDKGMTSELLTRHGIPNVEHICFMPPEKAFFVSDKGSWAAASALLQKYGTIVVKNNEGTGGDQVYLVSNQLELEQAAALLFARGCSMSVSPYEKILEEYRVILLDGEVQVMFSKERQGLTGDGEHSLLELYQNYLSEGGTARAIPSGDLKKVLSPGEHYYFEWKHNLGRGAGVRLWEASPETEPIRSLAKQVTDLLGARFVSVDVIRTEEGIKVLEVNAGVMMENLAGMSEETYRLAKSVYSKAIEKMLSKKGERGQKFFLDFSGVNPYPR